MIETEKKIHIPPYHNKYIQNNNFVGITMTEICVAAIKVSSKVKALNLPAKFSLICL